MALQAAAAAAPVIMSPGKTTTVFIEQNDQLRSYNLADLPRGLREKISDDRFTNAGTQLVVV